MIKKDWTGNKGSAFATLGASNHTEETREKHDYYATDPIAIDMLYQTGFFDGVKTVWEPAAGGGHLVDRMVELGLEVVASDLYDQGRGYEKKNFLSCLSKNDIPIVTNPPYKFALEFCEKAIEIGTPKFAMFMKLTFLEGQKRSRLFDKYPPKIVAVCRQRVICAKNGSEEYFNMSSAACYAWFIWEKDYKDAPIIKWIERKKINAEIAS